MELELDEEVDQLFHYHQSSSDAHSINDSQGTLSKWQIAAIYAKQGRHNEKFGIRSKTASRVYAILHHPAFYVTHLIVAILLMALILIEWPSLIPEESYTGAYIAIHGVIELILLTLLLVEFGIRLIWVGPREFFSPKKRKVYLLFVIFLMYIEALVVIARRDTHVRLLRVLRPVFLIDSYLMSGVRRVFRQIFQSFKPISEILFLLYFFVAFFAILGFFLFAKIDPDFFSSYGQSFFSMFILVTTANHPDVFMEAYNQRTAAPLFFVFYLIVAFYIIINVLLGVVYHSFNAAEKDKVKNLFLHKREALKRAYSTLASREGIEFADFLLFVKEYNPKSTLEEVLCIFKLLKGHKTESELCSSSLSFHSSCTNSLKSYLSLTQFYEFYDMAALRWHKRGKQRRLQSLYQRLPMSIQRLQKLMHSLVTWQWFNSIFSLVIIINIFVMIAFAITFDPEVNEVAIIFKVLGFVFIIIYCVEIVIRIIGFGPVEYFTQFLNVFDFILIIASFVGQVMELTPLLTYAILLRPLRLLRLLHLKRTYRHIMDAIGVLLIQLLSVGILIVVIYYIFAVIGMEVFHDKLSEQCCNDSWYFAGSKFTGARNETTPDVYWHNNFDNTYRSYVTLFEIMVGNEWQVIMEGFASQVDSDAKAYFVRIYFIAFYTVMLVVNSVIISHVVEGITFKIALRKKELDQTKICKRLNHHEIGCQCAEGVRKSITVEITQSDVSVLHTLEKDENVSQSLRNVTSAQGVYFGTRLRRRRDFILLMHKNEIPFWIEKSVARMRKRSSSSLIAAQDAALNWKRKLLKYLKTFLEYVLD